MDKAALSAAVTKNKVTDAVNARLKKDGSKLTASAPVVAAAAAEVAVDWAKNTTASVKTSTHSNLTLTGKLSGVGNMWCMV